MNVVLVGGAQRRSWSAAARRSSTTVSVDRFLPHAEPAPWAGYTRVASGSVSSLSCSESYSWPASSSRVTARRRQQVGPADVADEQRVAGQHAVRHGVVGVLVDDDADRLRGVAGRVADLEHDLAERDALAVGELA